MAKVMSNRQVVQEETKAFLPTQLNKKSYYREGRNLIYIVDILPERDFFLIEDVRSNHVDWRPADSLKIEAEIK